MKLNGAVIGNHEFDKGKKFLYEYINSSSFSFINSNMSKKSDIEIE